MSEFVNYLHDVFEAFGPVSTRRMFGGHGVYFDGLMFGLVVDDVLYLKVDDLTRGDFLELDMEPFEYLKQGKPMKLSYYSAPEEIYEDKDIARHWAEKAFAAALRGNAAKSKSGKSKPGNSRKS